MAADLGLQPVVEGAPLRGLANLLRKEHRAWWGTRRWWVNALLWPGALGGLVAIMLFLLPSVAAATGDPQVAAAGGPVAFGLEVARSAFFELGGLAVAIGVIVLCQDLIVDERQSGVTEWLLSRPVARHAYVLAKLGAALLAVLALLVALPALVAYTLMSARVGAPLAPLPFLAGVGIVALHTLCYLALTLMLGTLLAARPPLLGIALGALLGGQLLGGLLTPLLYVTPWGLLKLAAAVAAGLPLPAVLLWAPVAATAALSGAFVLVALAAFERAEL